MFITPPYNMYFILIYNHLQEKLACSQIACLLFTNYSSKSMNLRYNKKK